MIQVRKAVKSRSIPAIYFIATLIALMIASNGVNILTTLLNLDEASPNSGQIGFSN
jgi:hypothetical protein